MHKLFTGRLPVVIGWLTGFVVQGVVRSLMAGELSIAPFVPMTSASFILFTLYMIPDPATTPLSRRAQVAFGLAVGLVYGLLVLNHIVFGLFIALGIVSLSRGIGMHLRWMLRQRPLATDTLGGAVRIEGEAAASTRFAENPDIAARESVLSPKS